MMPRTALHTGSFHAPVLFHRHLQLRLLTRTNGCAAHHGVQRKAAAGKKSEKKETTLPVESSLVGRDGRAKGDNILWSRKGPKDLPRPSL